MKMTNPLYDKLKTSSKRIQLSKSLTDKWYLYLKQDTFYKEDIPLTKKYDFIRIIDELHMITKEKEKTQVQRFGFIEQMDFKENLSPDAHLQAIYVPMAERSLKDISGFEVIKDSSKTLLLKNKEGFYTYLDYNINSRFYMLTLVPEVLEEAEAFDEDFEGYAKVSFTDSYHNKRNGYICRDDFMAKNINEIKLYMPEDIKEKSLEKRATKKF